MGVHNPIGSAGSMGERPVFEGRIDLVRGQLVLERDDDSSVLAEFRQA